MQPEREKLNLLIDDQWEKNVDRLMIYLKTIVLALVFFLQSCGVPLIPGI